MAIVNKTVNGYGPYAYRVTYENGKHHWEYIGKASEVTNDLSMTDETLTDLPELTVEDITNAEEVDTLGGMNKEMSVVSVNGEKMVLIDKSDLTNDEIKNNLDVPDRLREAGFNAPKTEEVGDYIVMDYIDAEQVAYSDYDDSETLNDYLSAIYATGNPDASPLNILVDDSDELWIVDFDLANGAESNFTFEQAYGSHLGIEVDDVKERAEEIDI